MTVEPFNDDKGIVFKYNSLFDYSVKVMAVPRAMLISDFDFSGLEMRVASHLASLPKQEPFQTTPISFWQAALCVVVGSLILCGLSGLL